MPIFAGNMNTMVFHHLSLEKHAGNPENDMREGRLHLVTLGILALTTYGALVGTRKRVVNHVLLEQEKEEENVWYTDEEDFKFRLFKAFDGDSEKFAKYHNKYYKKIVVDGSLDLRRTPITSLPDNLHVGGDLDLYMCKNLTSLGDNLSVGGYLDLDGTSIPSLPDFAFDPQLTADRCNKHNKVTILHPHFCMTIVPMSIHGDRNDMGNEEVMRKHIREALMANEVSSRASQVLFDLHPHDLFDWHLAKQVLQEEAPQAPFVHTCKLAWIEPIPW
jgi:hypothetical protein